MATRAAAAGELVGHAGELLLQPSIPTTSWRKAGSGVLPVQLHRQDDVFVDVEHGHQVVVLKDEADVPPAEDGQLFVVHGVQGLAPTVTVPLVGGVQPTHQVEEVDLPEPEVPTTATNSPSSTVKFTPSRARVRLGSVP